MHRLSKNPRTRTTTLVIPRLAFGGRQKNIKFYFVAMKIELENADC